MKSILLFLILFPTIVKSQNLVPNASFEEYEVCPQFLDLTGTVTDWTSFSNTCDYYNSCASQGLMSVPQNVYGDQMALTGSAYAGILTYDGPNDPNYREYLGVELNETLIIGTKYFISYYVSRAGNFCVGYATNNLGGLFTTELYSPDSPLDPNNYSHFNETSVLTDTSQWIQIHGEFIADQNYSHLAIGNFYTIENTDTLYTGGPCNGQAYYYIDEVRVSTDSLYAWQSLSVKNVLHKSISIYPNPFNDHITVSADYNLLSIYLFDCTMKNVMNEVVGKRDQFCIHTSELPVGIYSLCVVHTHGAEVFKILKTQ